MATLLAPEKHIKTSFSLREICNYRLEGSFWRPRGKFLSDSKCRCDAILLTLANPYRFGDVSPTCHSSRYLMDDFPRVVLALYSKIWGYLNNKIQIQGVTVLTDV